MSITEIAVKRPTAVVVLFIILVGLGLMGYFNIGADLFPSANTPVVSIRSVYPGASSADIEKDLIKPMEDAVSGLPAIDKLRSVSGEGFGYIIIQFSMGADTYSSVQDVQKAIDAIAETLPSDATKPIITKYNMNAQPVMAISIFGDLPYEDLRSKSDDLKRALENVPGVGQIKLMGAPERELDVTVDRAAIDAYGVGITTIIGALKANNITLPVGILQQEGVDRPVRVLGEFSSLDDVRQLRIPLPKGGTLPLGELASIKLAYPENPHLVRMNGRSSIGLLVVKSSDANIVETAKRVKKELEAVRASLPSGVQVTVATDETIFINSSLAETQRDLLLGILVTSFVLFLFLRRVRSSLIVLVSIPVSLVSTFFMMYVCGFTLNIVSTMALALCIGILVDDSIVVLENIHRHRQLGKDAATAAIEGRKEIAMAAIAITLCDVVVFAPIAFMGDLVGQFFRQFGLTVVFAALFSLLVSFTLVPAMAAHLLGKEKEREEGSGGFLDKILKPAYKAILLKALSHRKLFLLIIGVLVAGSLALFPLKAIQTEFIPPFDQGKIVIDLNLGAGANIARTDQAMKAVEEHLAGMGEVENVFSQIGTDSGANFGNIIVRLKEKNARKKSQNQVAKELRTWAKTVPGVDISVTESSIVAQTSVEGSKPFIINITGPDRVVLRKIADQVETMVSETKGAVDVSNSMRARLSEFSVRVDRLALSEYSLNASDVAITLRAAFAGAKAGVFRKAGDEYDMIVKFSPEETRTPSDISSLTLYSPTGARVTIGQIADITRDDEPSSLERKDRANVVTIMANLQGRPLGGLVSDVQAKLDANPLPQGYKYILSGDTSNMNSSFVSLAWALFASLALVYLVLVVLYESWLTPFIRMLSLPVGIIGGLTAMAITGKSVNIISFIGIIMLDGLISKNGTLLIDYTHTLMKRGLALKDALIEAGQTRLRPILMTSSTMIVGMLPLALSTGASSEIKSGMAVVLIGGLVSSTLISPLFLPVAYTVIEDLRTRSHTRKAAKKSEAKK